MTMSLTSTDFCENVILKSNDHLKWSFIPLSDSTKGMYCKYNEQTYIGDFICAYTL